MQIISESVTQNERSDREIILIDVSVDWSVDWLIDWLVWLAFYFFSCFAGPHQGCCDKSSIESGQNVHQFQEGAGSSHREHEAPAGAERKVFQFRAGHWVRSLPASQFHTPAGWIGTGRLASHHWHVADGSDQKDASSADDADWGARSVYSIARDGSAEHWVDHCGTGGNFLATSSHGERTGELFDRQKWFSPKSLWIRPLIDWLIDRSVDWLITWLDCLIDWLVDFFDRLIDWLIVFLQEEVVQRIDMHVEEGGNAHRSSSRRITAIFPVHLIESMVDGQSFRHINFIFSLWCHIPCLRNFPFTLALLACAETVFFIQRLIVRGPMKGITFVASKNSLGLNCAFNPFPPPPQIFARGILRDENYETFLWNNRETQSEILRTFLKSAVSCSEFNFKRHRTISFVFACQRAHGTLLEIKFRAQMCPVRCYSAHFQHNFFLLNLLWRFSSTRFSLKLSSSATYRFKNHLTSSFHLSRQVIW